ncbi:MAG TPA: YXWGXW repeat-containing protein [Bryobacteraceae bacterium]|nr:YXWGXW repeat-containing protein [Bryobacteraceae bacterium]
MLSQIKHLTRNRWLLSAIAFLLLPAVSFAGIAVSITIAPPVMPVYVQPLCPGDGYIWTPGYWAWGPTGYYWVPGVWVQPPQFGLLWTPGYWGFGGGIYAWHAGYWGPHVGFYGGVNYGFGYPGVGFVGGFWAGNVFRYNTAVMNVNTTVVRNVYVDRTVIHNTTYVNRSSFNGPGGVTAQASPRELMASREQHFQATSMQMSHQNFAASDRNQLASVNHGNPSVAAMDSVNGRRFNQQGRIANGVQSGRLTAGETRNLEGREANLNHEIHNDRQANGGRLTPQEHQQVNQQQNNLSRSIYNDKHNGSNATYGNNRVGERRENQQDRISQGIRSGQMSAGQAARTESREQNINRQVSADRHANGGALNQQQRH